MYRGLKSSPRDPRGRQHREGSDWCSGEGGGGEVVKQLPALSPLELLPSWLKKRGEEGCSTHITARHINSHTNLFLQQ